MQIIDEISSRPPLRVHSDLIIIRFPAQTHPYMDGSCEQYSAENNGADGTVPDSRGDSPC